MMVVLYGRMVEKQGTTVVLLEKLVEKQGLIVV